MRGIRGANTVKENTAAEITAATKELLLAMLAANDLKTEDIGAVIFTATEDITAAFPAKGARELPGFALVPLFDARQMDVEGALEKCIRILLLADTDKSQKEIHHIYLGEAKRLRPDLQYSNP